MSHQFAEIMFTDGVKAAQTAYGSRQRMERFTEMAGPNDTLAESEAEFIGRLPVRVICQPLEVDDLYQVLNTSEGSILRQYEQDFGAYGIDLKVTEGAMHRIAERAAEEKTGARGLMTVCERIFRDYKFELPSSCTKKLEVLPELVDNPGQVLDKLLQESQNDAVFQGRQAAHEFVDQ